MGIANIHHLQYMIWKQQTYKEKQVDWIKLQRMVSQDDLPVSSGEIAIPENIQQWKYLHRIQEMKMDRNLYKLLIGANCLKALDPPGVQLDPKDSIVTGERQWQIMLLERQQNIILQFQNVLRKMESVTFVNEIRHYHQMA